MPRCPGRRWTTSPAACLRGAGLPELRPREPDTEYPLSITVNMSLMISANILLFCYAAWLSFRSARWLLALCGPLQPAALALAVAYLSLSFWLYSRPVNALQVHAEQLHPSKLAQSAADLAALGKKGR
jgi:hypothetical protein